MSSPTLYRKHFYRRAQGIDNRCFCGTEILKTWIGSSVVVATLCVSYLVKTCKHILSCTEDFVGEREAYNATQASRFSKIHRPSFIYSNKLEVPLQVRSGVFMSRDRLCPVSFFSTLFDSQNWERTLYHSPFRILRVCFFPPNNCWKNVGLPSVPVVRLKIL